MNSHIFIDEPESHIKSTTLQNFFKLFNLEEQNRLQFIVFQLESLLLISVFHLF